MLKCIPLDPGWTGSETKLDLKAIYRRRKQNNWGTPILDAEGREQWDTTGPLPLRKHTAWTRKGFVYVTLADYESLEKVAPYLQAADPTLDWRTYIQDLRTRSPFNSELYLKGLSEQLAKELQALKAMVAKFGAEAVTEINRATDPDWQMPAGVLDVPDAGKRGPGRPRKDEAAA